MQDTVQAEVAPNVMERRGEEEVDVTGAEKEQD